MNYNDAIKWINSFEQFGIKLGLDRITFICNKLKNPENNYKIIHVGGTNGKGSVCKFLEGVLTSNGYSVGTYTSPHLQRFSERIIVNNKEINDKEVVNLVKKIKPIVHLMLKKNDIPTYFEIVTAIAFEYFKEKNIDYAIIEVGLGGRFDATNIVTPIISIITNISYEHQDKLGITIEEIAFEKAGIIKNNIPIVTASKDSALKVIKKISSEKNAQLIHVKNSSWQKISGNIYWQDFLIKGSIKDYTIKTSLLGNFQGENIAITLAAIEILQMEGVYITDDSIFNGFKKIIHSGRMEILGFEPLILLDGAHNIEGIKALKVTLNKDFVYDKLILIIGISSNKKVKEMLDIITPIANTIIVTKSNNKRAKNPLELKQLINKKEVKIKNNISEAIEFSKKIATKKDLICITGSLFIIGESRNLLF